MLLLFFDTNFLTCLSRCRWKRKGHDPNWSQLDAISGHLWHHWGTDTHVYQQYDVNDEEHTIARLGTFDITQRRVINKDVVEKSHCALVRFLDLSVF